MRDSAQKLVTLVALVVSAVLGSLVVSNIPPPKSILATPAAATTFTETVSEGEALAATTVNAPSPASFETPRKLSRPVQTADEYLCEVYERTPIKRDGSGDFTWKDPAAAKRHGMDLCAYVIGGMAPKLRTQLAALGHAADAKGINWSITSGFRDDWRQSVASGLKAGNTTSQHGGSRATRGYGDGHAADITASPIQPLLALIDQMGPELGLIRPHKGFDPNHVKLGEAGSSGKLVAKTGKVRHAKRHRKSSHRRA